MSKMIKKLDNGVLSNDDLSFGDIDSDTVTFFSNDIGLNSINLNNINLDYYNFDDYDPEFNNHLRLMAWYKLGNIEKYSIKFHIDPSMAPAPFALHDKMNEELQSI